MSERFISSPTDLPPAYAAALENAFESARDPLLLVGDDGRVAAVNAVARRRFGIPCARPATPIEDLLPAPASGGAGSWPELWAALRRNGADGVRVRLGDAPFDVTLAGGGDAPSVLHALAMREGDSTDHRRAATFMAVADCSHDAVLALDGAGRVAAVSARTVLVLGYSERALRGRPLGAVVVPERRAELDGLVRQALAGADVTQHDTQARRRDRSIIDIVVDLAPVPGSPGDGVVGVSAIIQDITERKELERELRHRSERDPLTGLYNRRRFDIELHRAARLAGRHGQGGALILLDVDRFKSVNDTHGHPGGDQLLRDLARALTTSVRDSDVPARLGGDEFAVLLPNTDCAGALSAAHNLLESARAALCAWDASVSAGTACFGRDTAFDPERALTAADQALYRAKASGGDTVEGCTGR